MFERFTPPARKAVVIAQELARRFRQPIIAPVHLVLGGFGADDPAMAALLDQLGVDGDEAVERISAITDLGSSDLEGHIPFHDDTKQVIVAGVQTARAMGDDHIATTHLLAGFLRLDRGRVSDVLAELGVTADRVTAALTGGAAGEPTFQVRTTKGFGRFRRGGGDAG